MKRKLTSACPPSLRWKATAGDIKGLVIPAVIPAVGVAAEHEVRMAAETRIVYGIQAVRRALLSGRAQKVYLQSDLGFGRQGRLTDELSRTAIPVESVPSNELARLTGTSKHQGAAARVPVQVALSEHEALDYLQGCVNPLALLLDGVQDPRNLGAILRTADAAGTDLVAYARSRNVGLTPVVSKVAAGAAEHQLRAEVGNLARFIEALTDTGMRVLGADDSAPQGLFETDLTGPLAIVVGAEGEGLRRLTRERCSGLISLPMRGIVESLNVAVAAGICLYECQRQRGPVANSPSVR
jgi:23S rRNA (guanosine2251-2'-O)-methyltransferase